MVVPAVVRCKNCNVSLSLNLVIPVSYPRGGHTNDFFHREVASKNGGYVSFRNGHDKSLCSLLRKEYSITHIIILIYIIVNLIFK